MLDTKQATVTCAAYTASLDLQRTYRNACGRLTGDERRLVDTARPGALCRTVEQVDHAGDVTGGAGDTVVESRRHRRRQGGRADVVAERVNAAQTARAEEQGRV